MVGCPSILTRCSLSLKFTFYDGEPICKRQKLAPERVRTTRFDICTKKTKRWVPQPCVCRGKSPVRAPQRPISCLRQGCGLDAMPIDVISKAVINRFLQCNPSAVIANRCATPNPLRLANLRYLFWTRLDRGTF